MKLITFASDTSTNWTMKANFAFYEYTACFQFRDRTGRWSSPGCSSWCTCVRPGIRRRTDKAESADTRRRCTTRRGSRSDTWSEGSRWSCARSTRVHSSSHHTACTADEFSIYICGAFLHTHPNTWNLPAHVCRSKFVTMERVRHAMDLLQSPAFLRERK